jgi:hypothetical protein
MALKRGWTGRYYEERTFMVYKRAAIQAEGAEQ